MTLSYEEGGECTRLTYAKFVKGEGEVEDVVAPLVTPIGSLPPSSIANLADGTLQGSNQAPER